jgi:hypothetical protein
MGVSLANIAAVSPTVCIGVTVEHVKHRPASAGAAVELFILAIVFWFFGRFVMSRGFAHRPLYAHVSLSIIIKPINMYTIWLFFHRCPVGI